MRIAALACVAGLLAGLPAGPAGAATGSPAQPEQQSMPTVLITGANRGIGLEIARVYAQRGWRVIATARSPGRAGELNAIAAGHDNVAVEQLDVTDPASVASLADKYRGEPVDVLLNNAGISGGGDNQAFGEFRYDVYHEVHDVNVLGPLRMAEAFYEHVKASEQKKIISISSTQGSISSTFGGTYFYRASKSALNMVMRTLAVEQKKHGITVGIISPGFVRTDFTKGLDFPFMITAKESAAAVVSVIDDYDLSKTGTFLRHTGEEAPW